MPLDPKRRGKTPRKRKPAPHGYSKRAPEAKKILLASAAGKSSTTQCVHSTNSADNEGSKSQTLVSATPTFSERKLENLYKIVDEDLDRESKPENSQQSDDIDSDTSDAETEISENVVLDGHRIIDVGILSANLVS